jgi:ABC-type multidrug transport system fused ATPase/permease subunit
MPAFQAIFGNLTTIRFNQPSLDIVAVELGRLREAEDVSSPVSEVVDNDCVKLGSSVIFESVSSRYAESEEPILQGINIVIPAFKTVGIVGSSGAGKSTFIDVLTGLLPIESGRILIDGVELSEQNVRAWRRSIGYVSQHVYLADDTVRRNIALGLHDREIDDAKVEQAARLANIHDFITESLPEKYATMIGENGVRLSGGQRQRLGIARALYRDPSVLVMDEATSALDGITEDAVIDAVRELSSKKTIVIVAHRLTTVQHCSNIYFLENGKVSDQGVYDDLLVRNATFRQMAKVAL